MASQKLQNICEIFGRATGVTSFRGVDGYPVSDVGKLRRWGGIRTPDIPIETIPEIKTRTVASQINPSRDLSDMVGGGPYVFPLYGGFDGVWKMFTWIPKMRQYPRVSVQMKTRELLMTRQSNLCAFCNTGVSMGKISNSDVDHIIRLHIEGTCGETNLQSLSVSCHRRKTALECRRVENTLEELSQIS